MLFFFWRKVNVLSAGTLTEEQLFSLFSSLHSITFAHSCCFPEQSVFNNMYRDALRNAGTLLADNLNVASDLLWSEMGAQGEVPPPGRAVTAGLVCSRELWQPAGEWGSCLSLAGSAGGRLEHGLLRRRAGELRHTLSLAREQLGFTAACRAAIISSAHTSKQEASRHLVADL